MAPVNPGPRSIPDENIELLHLDFIQSKVVIQHFLRAHRDNHQLAPASSAGCTGATRKSDSTIYEPATDTTRRVVAPVQLHAQRPKAGKHANSAALYTAKTEAAQCNESGLVFAQVNHGCDSDGCVIWHDNHAPEQHPSAVEAADPRVSPVQHTVARGDPSVQLLRDADLLSRPHAIKLHRCNAGDGAYGQKSWGPDRQVAPVQRPTGRVTHWSRLLGNVVLLLGPSIRKLHRCNAGAKEIGQITRPNRTGDWRQKRKGADEISPFPFHATDLYGRFAMT